MKQFALSFCLSVFSIISFTACNNANSNTDTEGIDGWYSIRNGAKDSISQKPFVTVKDFEELHLDTLFRNEDGTIHYTIVGKIKPEKLKVWGDATEEAAKNKQSIGFLYNGKIISNPYPNFRLDEGNFSIENMDGDTDTKHILKDLLKQMN